METTADFVTPLKPGQIPKYLQVSVEKHLQHDGNKLICK